MPEQENTAINDLIGFTSRKFLDVDEPAPFSPPLPAARLRPAPFGAHLSPIGATVAPLPRRRAPAATPPPQIPMHSDYGDDDSATTVDPPAGWGAQPAPPPWQPPPPPPQQHAAVSSPRPAYPPPHQPPAYYQAPYPDHLETVRVSPMPLEPEPSLGAAVLQWIARLWIPFAALGVIAIGLAGYRLIRDDAEPVAAVEAPIVMTAQTAEPPEPVQPAVAIAEPVAVEPPKDSLWRPTTPQPTLAPRVETVAAVETEPAVEMEPARTRKPSARASLERSSRRAAKRAAKRAKQVAVAEIAPTPARNQPRETKAVAVAAPKPMKIGAASAVPTKGTGAGKLTIASTPPTLIYVDGRNTGMMTPRTLSLAEGSHKITLLSPKDRIAKTISVEISAGKSANLTKNFTK